MAIDAQKTLGSKPNGTERKNDGRQGPKTAIAKRFAGRLPTVMPLWAVVSCASMAPSPIALGHLPADFHVIVGQGTWVHTAAKPPATTPDEILIRSTPASEMDKLGQRRRRTTAEQQRHGEQH